MLSGNKKSLLNKKLCKLNNGKSQNNTYVIYKIKESKLLKVFIVHLPKAVITYCISSGTRAVLYHFVPRVHFR